VPIDRTTRFPAAPAVFRLIVRRGALRGLGRLVRSATGARRVALISDPRVAGLYAGAARSSLRRAGIEARLLLVPRGERAKRPQVLERLWRELDLMGLDRQGAVVALGGGVVGDLAGFAAATWLRGIPWVGVPTTLLSQVDSSLGGKTGVDLATGKNLVGAFHQPRLVVSDPNVLRTLPARQLRAGLAEVVKTGMATDAGLFRWTERRAERLHAGDLAALEQAVMRTAAAKLRIVRRDEREREGGGRAALNYGHTLGHALEAAAGYRGLLHGEAVALGMRAAARLSEAAAGLPSAARARQDLLLDRLGLPRRMRGVPLARLFAAMSRDKKRRSALVRWVLTPQVGHASVPRPVESRLVRSVLKQLGARSS
jgi:3-dehydroquinate synthase